MDVGAGATARMSTGDWTFGSVLMEKQVQELGLELRL